MERAVAAIEMGVLSGFLRRWLWLRVGAGILRCTHASEQKTRFVLAVEERWHQNGKDWYADG
ncbi:MAG: hypothetical protein IPH35_04080 [Rhodoferax sp.]|nr:hypothetical protein [Rhodoferax sp.]